MLSGKPPEVDYREVLKPEEFEMFSRLREWRKALAEKEGVPVYTLLTNEQLANKFFGIGARTFLSAFRHKTFQTTKRLDRRGGRVCPRSEIKHEA